MKIKTIFIFILSIFACFIIAGLFFLVGDRTLKILEYSVKGTLLISGIVLASAFILQRFLSAKSANGLLIGITVTCVICILLLISGEYFFRFIYKDVTSTGDGYSYFHKKWLKTVRYNSFRFRERDFDLEKPDGVYRIAVVGDSMTFGPGIEEEHRYSNLLEKRLNNINQNSHTRYEVLNFGKPGAETLDHVYLLKLFVLPSNPDFILLQWYINDVKKPRYYKKNLPASKPEKKNVSKSFISIPKILRQRSALFYLLHKQLAQLQSGSTTSYDEATLARFGNPISEDSIKAMGNLKKFIQISKSNNISMGMVLFSDTYFRPSSKLDFLLIRVLNLCEDAKIFCVDMREPLEPYKGDTKLWANRLDPHPSAFANRIATDQIYTKFSQIWLKP
jgi:hypothetical protein